MYSFWIDKKWLRLTFLALMAVLELFWNAFRLYIYIYCIRCQVEQTKAPCEGQARESANFHWLVIATHIYIYIYLIFCESTCHLTPQSIRAAAKQRGCCRTPFPTWSNSFRRVSDLFETTDMFDIRCLTCLMFEYCIYIYMWHVSCSMSVVWHYGSKPAQSGLVFTAFKLKGSCHGCWQGPKL